MYTSRVAEPGCRMLKTALTTAASNDAAGQSARDFSGRHGAGVNSPGWSCNPSSSITRWLPLPAAPRTGGWGEARRRCAHLNVATFFTLNPRPQCAGQTSAGIGLPRGCRQFVAAWRDDRATRARVHTNRPTRNSTTEAGMLLIIQDGTSKTPRMSLKLISLVNYATMYLKNNKIGKCESLRENAAEKTWVPYFSICVQKLR